MQRSRASFELPPAPGWTPNRKSIFFAWRLDGSLSDLTEIVIRLAASADSFRRQIDSPGDPIASVPSVAGSGVGVVNDAVGSPSSGPLVAPAMIDLPGMVS